MKTTYYYKFEDGYFCWTAGRLTTSEKWMLIKEHGEMVAEVRA